MALWIVWQMLTGSGDEYDGSIGGKSWVRIHSTKENLCGFSAAESIDLWLL